MDREARGEDLKEHPREKEAKRSRMRNGRFVRAAKYSDGRREKCVYLVSAVYHITLSGVIVVRASPS